MIKQIYPILSLILLTGTYKEPIYVQTDAIVSIKTDFAEVLQPSKYTKIQRVSIISLSNGKEVTVVETPKHIASKVP